MAFVRRETLFQLYYGFLSECALIAPGMSIAYTSVTLPALQRNDTMDVTLSMDEGPLFVSLLPIMEIVGTLFSIITMKRGRRFALICGDAVSCCGWILMATSYNVPQLFVGRIITGLATGMSSTPGVVYLGEMATTRLIPFFTTANSNFLTLGVLAIYVMGSLSQDDWRSTAIAAAIPPLIISILNFCLLPESPRWLLLNDRRDDARKSLLKLRGLKDETPHFQMEFAEMIEYNESRKADSSPKNDIENERDATTWFTDCKARMRSILRALKLPEVWKSLLIMNLFFLFQQFCGIYVLISYSVDFLTDAGITVDPYFTSVGMGLIELASGIIIMCFSTRFNRRSISIMSCAGMSISLGALAVYKEFFARTEIAAIPLTCIVFFVTTGTMGIHVIPWAMIGELYPTRYVGVLGPLTCCAAAFYNFVTLQIYPYMAAYDERAVILFYCLVSVASTIFVASSLPETRGKTKTEIEEEVAKKSILFVCR